MNKFNGEGSIPIQKMVPTCRSEFSSGRWGQTECTHFQLIESSPLPSCQSSRGTLHSVVRTPRSQKSGSFSPVPFLADRTEKSPLHQVFKKTEAKEDPSWKTEVLADNAKKQLKKLGKLLFKTPEKPIQSKELAAIVHPDFRGESMRPPLKEVFRDAAFQISRRTPNEPASDFPSAVAAWRISMKPGRIDGEFPMRWKVIAVETEEEGFSTRVRLEVDGESPARERLAQIAQLTCRWTDDETPLRKSWEVDRCEATKLLSDSPSPFIDHTQGLMKSDKTFPTNSPSAPITGMAILMSPSESSKGTKVFQFATSTGTAEKISSSANRPVFLRACTSK